VVIVENAPRRREQGHDAEVAFGVQELLDALRGVAVAFSAARSVPSEARVEVRLPQCVPGFCPVGEGGGGVRGWGGGGELLMDGIEKYKKE
jgi:hypothetical protein